MTRRRSIVATLLSVAIGLTGLLVSGAASASSVPDSAATSARATVHPDALPTVRSIVAVRGLNSSLWIRTSNPSGKYYNLGGKMSASPAVAWSHNLQTAYYVVVGTDKQLWVRNQYHTWHHLVPHTTACVHAAGVLITGNTITVACTGYYSGKVFLGTAALPTNRSLPVMNSMANYGGVSLGGITIYHDATSNQNYFWVLSNENKATTGNVYSHVVGSPASSYTAEQYFCQSRPAVTGNDGTSTFYLGCQNRTPALRYRTPTGTHSAIGKIIGGVGIAVASDGSSATYYVVSPKGGIFRINISSTEHDLPFTNIGGQAYHAGSNMNAGVSAVTIS